ncbi:MAG: hypothetical protein EOM34_04015, partial [Clostridia bacterium]|nr:hypothetical protein [Clostridia bacterium]NCD02771.1 hypothetical protein [Clostridia bacterium]
MCRKSFTASFEANAQTYIVQHIDEDTDAVLETSEAKDTTFGTEITGTSEKKNINGYTFVRAEDLTVGTNNDENIVKVYYSKDEKGGSDDIPDKYQVTFTYAAGANGKVEGTTTEVKTVQEI